MKINMNIDKDLPKVLGKEFWGMLHFEIPLTSLYEFLGVQHKGVGIKRFSDWVLFPEKIPLDFQKVFYQKLASRQESPDYIALHSQQSSASEDEFHYLIVELLQLKYANGALQPSSLKHIYTLSHRVFWAISLQFVERGYVSAEYMFSVQSHFKERREGQHEAGS
jgi:hypothetical protein